MANNYETMKMQMREEFLEYDQAAMNEKFSLRSDDENLYITFFGTEYAVNRHTGDVRSQRGEAGYNEAMTIYDVLCYAQKDASLCGEFCSVMQLDGIAKSSNPGGFLFSSFCRHLEGRQEALRKACEALGGIPFPIGEVAYQLPLFDFLPIVLQYWDADDEFPGQLMIKWDRNILQYMHFETTFYATGCLLHRILELLDT
jgi:hypothetical protein